MRHLEMDYNTVFSVMDSWEQLRRSSDDYEKEAGLRLFEILFNNNPQAKELFGLHKDMDPTSDAMKTNRHFVAHAKLLISMLDRSLQMLGPDAELLGEILTDLGKKHTRLGVTTEQFPMMGQALIQTLREQLGANYWTAEMESSWEEVYNAMTLTMCNAMNTDKIVVESWAKVKSTSTFEKCGTLLFEQMFQRCPETKTMFGFSLDAEPGALFASRRFKLHASFFVEMLDRSIEMVEAKQLEENMSRLGALHVSYGVKEEYFEIMGDALFYALEIILKKNDWKEATREAWQDVYGKMASLMIAAMKTDKK